MNELEPPFVLPTFSVTRPTVRFTAIAVIRPMLANWRYRAKSGHSPN